MDSGNTVGSLHSSEDECNSRAATLHDPGGFITTHYLSPPTPPFNHQNQINNPFFFTPPPHHHLQNLDSKTLPDGHYFFPSQPAAHSTVPFSPANTTEAITPTNPLPQVRNPRKRSRASRKAPTTVMTTDASNFRAMVQEFTGIPAPPFTPSSPTIPSLTTSFDLFGRPPASAMMRSNTNFDNLPQLPPYLLHPFPQKLQSSSCHSSSISSFLDSSNLLNTTQNTITFPSNTINQSPLILNPKTTQNVASLNGIDVIRKSTQIHEDNATLPGLVSTAPIPTTTTTTRTNKDPVASGNWGGGGGGGNVKESFCGMKDDQPWSFSSD